MIKSLRRNEELVLEVKSYKSTEVENQQVIEYLQHEYEEEQKDYPSQAPEFDLQAGIYGAKFLYYTAQLILFRDERPEEIAKYFEEYKLVISPSAMLSADLSMRFIPYLLKQIKLIDAEDEIIPMIEKSMSHWPYSALGIKFSEKIDYELPSNACLTNLFIDRVIENKLRTVAQLEQYSDLVKGKLGDYGKIFWNEFYIENEKHTTTS